MAPDAKLINVKVGTADGGVDVSQLVAAIEWVVKNRVRQNIRVLNLSSAPQAAIPAYGTQSISVLRHPVDASSVG